MAKRYLFLVLLSVISIHSVAQIRVGVRDNKFVGLSYTYNNTWKVKLEESVFSEKFEYQYIRGYLSYEYKLGHAEFEISSYWGGQWNGYFQDYGVTCEVIYTFSKLSSLYGILNPHKDLLLGYNTCYEFGGTIQFSNNIGLCLSYRNIPEYRIVNKRIRTGVIFTEDRLNVTPLLSIPTDGNFKEIRFILNFEWTFRKNK